MHQPTPKTSTSSRQERLDFLNIDENVKSTLKTLEPTVAELLPGVLDDFYKHISAWAPVSKFFDNDAMMKSAKARQLTHWANIMKGTFDDTYEESVKVIGRTHNRLGLEPRWYIGGYAAITSGLVQELIDKAPTLFTSGQKEDMKNAFDALLKSVMLDMDFAISTYLEAMEEDKKRAMSQLADDFENNIGSIIEHVVSSSTELTATAHSLGSIVEKTNSQTNNVASASEEMTASMQTVASASQELTGSIREISDQIVTVSNLSQKSVTEAELASQKVQDLSNAAGKISDVVDLIRGVAEQTNLLALNAAVEAARAGDAGKGFAVVANEVKALATQTQKATEEVAESVSKLQNETQTAATAILGIVEEIGKIHQAASSVTTAVEEQTSATEEITRNVEQSSIGTKEVNESVGLLSDSSEETGSSSKEVLQAANDLSDQSDSLKEKVDEFLENVRNS